MTDPVRALRDEIGAPPPPSIVALEPEQLERLRALVSDARRRQAEALNVAVDDGLGFLPRLMRAAVKRALLG